MGLAQRFESKVDDSPGHGPWGDCHVWTDKPLATGYGVIHTDDGPQLAHRVALILAGIDPGEQAHHRCEVKLCVNVNHLEPLTAAEHPTRHRSTHCARGHRMAGDNVYVRRDNGHRMCRTCQRERRRRRYVSVERLANAGRTF